MELAPIALFVYNRPWHIKKTLEALATNDLSNQSVLFIYADGPKKDASKEELKSIYDVRKVIREKNWCQKVNIIESNKNKGLADSIISGVTEIVNKYGKVIVLEDDIVTSKGFLRYMNDALDLYKNEDKVMHIAGHVPPIKLKLPETFFYNQTSCWGWGTWKRAWKYFNIDAEFLLNKLIEGDCVYRFNIDGSYPFINHLKENINGNLNTWAVKWQASVYLANGLCLHPRFSLAKNIGLDGSGVYSGKSNHFNHTKLIDKINVEPVGLIESSRARKQIGKFYRRISGKEKLLDKIKIKLKLVLNTYFERNKNR